MLLADEEGNFEETCKLTSSEALNLMQPLHALIDNEIKKGPYVLPTGLEENCADSCHCGIYSDLVGNENVKEDLFKKAQSMPKKALIACAQKTVKWFCSSKLLKILKSEASTEDSTFPNAL